MDHSDFLKNAKPSTQILTLGYNPVWSEGSAVPPVFRTSTFIFKNAEEGKRAFELAYGLTSPKEKEIPALIYSRVNNPNMEIVENRLTIWDKTEAAALFSSGLAAISNMCLSFCQPDDEILFSDPVYGGTEFLLRHILPEFGIKTHDFPSGSRKDQMLEHARQCPKLKIIFIETPSNPTIQLTSIKEAREVVDILNKERDTEIILAVDNTFIGPIFLSPIDHGADLIVYSITKFIGGHSDLVAGGVLGRKTLIDRIKMFRTALGAIPDPDTSWLILRSLPTLQLRMESQCKSAQRIVSFLLQHPKVYDVNYPGLPENDAYQNQVFKAEYSGTGSLISFKVKGGEKEAFSVLNNSALMHLAVSLGGVESLIQHPSTMTHSDMTPDEKKHAGITDNLIRISVGLEDPDDLITDLERALKTI